jgi:uncharacterized membrane protein
MLGGWTEFAAALAVFMLSHAIPVRPPVRPWLIAWLGRKGYFLSYSLLSVLILVWLVGAAQRAPFVAVLPHSELWRWAPILAMPLACLLAAGGMAARNPLSFGGLGRRPFNPEFPGILAVSRHPLLAALALWSGAHLLANGDLAHVILFGLFTAFAVIGMKLIDRRKKQAMGEAEWRALSRNTGLFRLSALRINLVHAAAALAAFFLLLLMHMPVIGYNPLP